LRPDAQRGLTSVHPFGLGGGVVLTRFCGGGGGGPCGLMLYGGLVAWTSFVLGMAPARSSLCSMKVERIAVVVCSSARRYCCFLAGDVCGCERPNRHWGFSSRVLFVSCGVGLPGRSHLVFTIDVGVLGEN
jgi:hypothetical protein